MGQCVRVMRRLGAVPARTIAGAVAKLGIVAESALLNCAQAKAPSSPSQARLTNRRV